MVNLAIHSDELKKKRYKRAAAKRVLVIESIKNLKSNPDGMKSSTQSYPGGAAAASRPLIKSMKKVGSQATFSRTRSVSFCVLISVRVGSQSAH